MIVFSYPEMTEERLILNTTYSFFQSAAFAPDGKTIAIAEARNFLFYGYGRVVIVDLESGKIVQSFNVPTGLVFSLAYSPDGKTLAAGTANGFEMHFGYHGGEVLFYNIVKRKVESQIDPKVRDIDCLAYSKDGSQLAIGGGGGGACIFRVSEARLIRLPIDQWVGGSGVCTLSFSKDGRRTCWSVSQAN